MNNNALLVGLFGPPRSGKNSVVEVFVNKFAFVPLSISGPIKEKSHEVAGIAYSEDEKDCSKKELSGRTPRDLYIHLGNLDDFVPQYWVDETIKRISPHRGARYIIESVGKQHQWNRILESGIVPRIHLVEVDRPGCKWDSRTPIVDSKPAWHVFNDTTLVSLETQAASIADKILKSNDIRYTGETWEFLRKFQQ